MWAEHVVMKHDVLVNAGQQQPHYTVCPKKSEPLNILQQQPQICSDLNKILHTQGDIYFCH